MTQQHTKGLLVVKENQSGFSLRSVDQHCTIANISKCNANHDFAEGDARRLAHAWNCHYDMIQTMEICAIRLESLIEYLERQEAPRFLHKRKIALEIQCSLEQAVKKAKGEGEL